tara:strand:- start:9146 stop:9331 length:186 start_codon:yes stop_codon:yes gene_type:complete
MEKILKNKSFFYLIVAASLVPFLVSVYFWFFTSGNEMEAIFVGIWVPSILSFATLLQVTKK